jgi:nifR3 family TIM-barrel protein
VRIGTVKIESKLALAPMAGVCDLAFRSVCRRFGAGLTYTEMISAKALVYQDGKTRSLLRLGEDEHPAAAQIFGSDADCMGKAARLAREISGADIIDINMGCPVGKVVKSGDGSALMLDPDKAGRIIEAVRESVDCPVTVKIRKGWDKGNINAVSFAKMAEDAGASAVAVHGRTRVQMYSGVADWDVIKAVKQAVRIPVLANGDVFTAGDAVRILKYTGADMAMIGRGAFGNPWLFAEAKAALDGEAPPPRPALGERVDTAVAQFELAGRYKGEKIACLEARKHFAWYLKGVRHAGYFREKISRIETMDDIYRVADTIKRELR